MRIKIENESESCYTALSLRDFLEFEARTLRHNKAACGCGLCAAYRSACTTAEYLLKRQMERERNPGAAT